MSKRAEFVYIFIVALIGLGSYFSVLNVFYQQDEWNMIGRLLATKGFWNTLEGFDLNLSSAVLGQGRLFSLLLGKLFFDNFFLDTKPLAIYSLFLHVVNTVAVFYLARRILDNLAIAFLAALFFSIASVPSEAVTWFGTSIGTLPATTLAILATVTFFNKRAFLPFLFLYLSLFFKETGVFLFLVLPVLSLVLEEAGPRNLFRKYWYFIIFFGVIVFLRVWEFRSIETERNLFITGATEKFWQVLLIRSVLYPLTSFSLAFIPPNFMLDITEVLAKSLYPKELLTDLVRQTIVLDLLAVFVSALLISLFMFLIYKEKERERKKIIFLLLIVLSSYLPFAIISKSFAYLDSRHYYLPMAFGSLLFAWAVIKLFSQRVILKLLAGFLVVSYLFLNITFLDLKLDELESTSRQRRALLAQIKELVPNLEASKNVFYIDSDREIGYYVENNKLPFQQGTGYTLMVLYYDSGRIPNEFLREDYLWEIGSQGYRRKNGLGFGYFWSMEELTSELQKNDEEGVAIHGLFYNSETKSFEMVEPKL